MHRYIYYELCFVSAFSTVRRACDLLIMVMSCRLSWVLSLSLIGLLLPSLPIASAKAIGRTERWLSPCSGSKTIFSIETELSDEEEGSKLDLVVAFDNLAKKSVSLRRRVRSTKTRYVSSLRNHTNHSIYCCLSYSYKVN